MGGGGGRHQSQAERGGTGGRTMTAAAQPGQVDYPFASFRFSVEIAGISQGVFQECTGFSATTEAHEVKEGGLNGYSLKLPGRTTFANITLKRGVTSSKDLWNWYVDVMSKADKSTVFKDIS